MLMAVACVVVVVQGVKKGDDTSIHIIVETNFQVGVRVVR